MRFLNKTGFLRIGILSLILMFSVGPVNAQSNANTRTHISTDRDNDTTRIITTERDNDGKWGWIGLLGLLGLAGLLPKKRTYDQDHIDTGNRTMTR